MSPHGPTWAQLETNMDLKIIAKPLFFLSFFDILRKSLEAFWNALGDPLGTPWGGLGDALGGLGGVLEGLGGALGGLGSPPRSVRRENFAEPVFQIPR